jgi:hypothetical protein
MTCPLSSADIRQRIERRTSNRSGFTKNNTSNTSRLATNAGSRTARRHGDARNTHGHDDEALGQLPSIFRLVLPIRVS